ncbi:MAG: SWIM zinc finger family protein [Planctomycetaceae bacterium]|nr:SWIM zinc finger family protein [Planctomycetaceae bacterium]
MRQRRANCSCPDFQINGFTSRPCGEINGGGL